MPATLVHQEVPSQEGGPIDGDRWIADTVFKQLGKPKDLFRIQIRNLWGNNFRVNVYREVEERGAIPRVEMTESYFVTTDHESLTSKPAIERKY